MTGADYEVRRAADEDWEIIRPFIAVCYGAGAPFKDRARWSWQFAGGPYEAPPGEATVWIAVKDGEVAGQIAVQNGRVFIEGRPIRIGWIVDVMVAPAHRGRGLGHLIHDAIHAEVDALLTLTMAPATRRIAERAGAVTLGRVRQMVRVGRLSGSTLAAVIGPILSRRPLLRTTGRLFEASRVAPWLAARSASAALTAARATGPRSDRSRVEETARLDLDLCERLFELEKAKLVALCDRGRAFCDWRFNRVPDVDYVFGQLRRGAGAEGLAVWRLPHPSELNIGVLVDIMADPDDLGALRDLAGHAVQRMAPRCEAIIAGASHPNHIRALADAGFITLKTHRPTVVTRTAELKSLFAQTAGSWHFTKADHDWDQIHPADH